MNKNTPIALLSIDGQSITPELNKRLIELTINDSQGIDSDQLDITLSDHDNSLILPKKGVLIHCQLGYKNQPLIDKGSYTVDEIEHSGPPDKLTIRARSADFRAGFKEQKERSWSQKTIGDIVKTIASTYQLKPIIASTLSTIIIEHIDQTNESDANLITRIATQHDAIGTIKNGNLLMMPKGISKTASNHRLPTVTIARHQTSTHRLF